MTTILAYIGLAFCSWAFSAWTWNRANAIGGAKQNEPASADFIYAIAFPLAILCLRVIFT